MKKLMIAGALLAMLSGCATKEYVHDYLQGKLTPIANHEKWLDAHTTEISANSAGVAGVQSTSREALQRAMDAGRLTEAQGRQIANHENWLDAHTKEISANSAGVAGVQGTAREALQRAMDAGRLAEGKFVYATVLNDGTLRFPLGQPALSADSMKALDAFAARLRSENRNVYVEIQGHTDNTGSAAGNQALGQARAMAVRDYLAVKGGVPLHRMDVISYGATAPVTENKTRKGREQNRRVVLVVLK